MPRVNIDRLKMEWAGVPAGAKILVLLLPESESRKDAISDQIWRTIIELQRAEC
jgi:hypothetical protein